jgi:protein SCO1/2
VRSRAFGVAAALIVGSFVIIAWILSAQDKTTQEASKSILNFTLIDQEEHIVHNEDLREKWLLVSLGSTKCHEICLAKLGTISVIMKELGDIADQIQPILITVDPERDTPSILRNYLRPFDSRILGLTGTLAQVQAVIGWFRVHDKDLSFDLGEIKDEQLAFFYLLNEKHEYAERFASPLSMLETLAFIRARLHDDSVR